MYGNVKKELDLNLREFMYLHSECTQFASSCLMQFTFSCDSLNLLDKYRVTSLVMGSWGLRCQVWQEILCDLRSYFGQFLIWKATKWVCHFFTLRAICLKMCKNDACKMDIYPWVFYTHGPTNFYCLSVCMSARKLLKITSKQLWKHLRFSASGLYECWCLNWSNWIWGVFRYF